VTGPEAETIGLAGGIALLVVLGIGYVFGGKTGKRSTRRWTGSAKEWMRCDRRGASAPGRRDAGLLQWSQPGSNR
jgi:hypothetical protein